MTLRQDLEHNFAATPTSAKVNAGDTSDPQPSGAFCEASANGPLATVGIQGSEKCLAMRGNAGSRLSNGSLINLHISFIKDFFPQVPMDRLGLWTAVAQICSSVCNSRPFVIIRVNRPYQYLCSFVSIRG